MKITLISYDNWGFNDKIAKSLTKTGHQVNHIDFHKFRYKYPSFSYRIYNFFLKMFTGKNLKNIYYGEEILRQLKSKEEIQDLILTIKGDFIDPKSILEFKKYAKKSIAFFNDSIARYPKTVDVLDCFDQVYSFEKDDCKKHGLTFKTNFIYEQETFVLQNKKYEYQLFNISSFDKRSKTILKIAEQLSKINIDCKIIIYDKSSKIKESKFVTLIRKPIPLEDIDKYISNSKVLLHIQRNKQQGLTFRVFESLGKNKKLITTNPDIKNYDFYNENNILVIDPENPVFPKSFFETDYMPVSEEILRKYQLENWANDFLN